MSQIKNLALLTDLYELTMAASYFDHQMFEPATFSLFIRNYPPSRRYFVSAGLEDVLSYLQDLKFTPEDLEYLEGLELFKPEFLSYLDEFRFRGDVYAIPEGRLFFVNEPVLEVTGSLIEAQIVETLIINIINYQSMIATKASRCVHAAWPRKLVDFSLRRTHGADAGLKVARASFIMAHSFITSFEDEIEAFRAFAHTFPDHTVLLVDTYDTLSGTRIAAEVGKELAFEGKELKGVRLDSGDIASLSKEARDVLRKEGFEKATIFASGGFDEYKIKKVLYKGGDVDSFGVGTKMGVSADAPYFDMAYKMVRYAGRPVLKLSPGKLTLASDKQVFRFKNPKGKLTGDVIGLRDDNLEEGEPLLEKVMSEGEIATELPSLSQIQKSFLDEFSLLHERHKSIDKEGKEYPVDISSSLKSLQAQVVRKLNARENNELEES
jgi:nicotinate phosphoribosyltransferase